MSNPIPLTVYVRLNGDFLCDGALWTDLSAIQQYRAKYFPQKPVIVTDCPKINDDYFGALLANHQIGYCDKSYESI